MLMRISLINKVFSTKRMVDARGFNLTILIDITSRPKPKNIKYSNKILYGIMRILKLVFKNLSIIF